MDKRTVHFYPDRVFVRPAIGRSAVVLPIDHDDSERVSNTKHVITSSVVKVSADGSFETQHSIYVPQRKSS
jgi:hypothetical protein